MTSETSTMEISVAKKEEAPPAPAPALAPAPAPAPTPARLLSSSDNGSVGGRTSWAGRTSQVLVRALASCSTLAATLIIALDQETEVVAGFSMHADYKSSPTFRFFLIGNGITCSYSLLSMFLVCLLGRNCVFHLVDMLAMGLAIACAAAAHAVGNVGKYGNDRTGWLPVCDYFKSYCKKMEISIGCCYLGVLWLYLLCALTAVQKASQNSKNFVQKE